jgi:hypothetical protein
MHLGRESTRPSNATRPAWRIAPEGASGAIVKLNWKATISFQLSEAAEVAKTPVEYGEPGWRGILSQTFL